MAASICDIGFVFQTTRDVDPDCQRHPRLMHPHTPDHSVEFAVFHNAFNLHLPRSKLHLHFVAGIDLKNDFAITLRKAMS